MTNERHEKALEAAYVAALTFQGTSNTKEIETAIDAYLQAMDAVIVPKEPTPANTVSACMSYRHDFGLLPPLDREALGRTANNWLEAWIKASPNHFTNGE